MWPWEHVLFAYLLFSVGGHARSRSPPGDGPVLALVVGSLLPDLVDKPLAWQFGLVQSGWSVAHSVFVAVPVVGLAYAVARRSGSGGRGFAFGLGYLAHLLGDVWMASAARDRLYLTPVLWPVESHEPIEHTSSLLEAVVHLLTLYGQEVVATEPTPALLARLGLVVIGTGLWIYDGWPGVRPIVGAVDLAMAKIRGE